MPFNGTGTFSLTPTSVAPAVSNTTISSTDFNTTTADIVTNGLNKALCRDGQATATGNQPMGAFKHTGVGNAAARTEYATAGQIQDSSLTFDATETGTGDAYEITLAPAITAYTAGQCFKFIASEANTGASTLNVNGVGAVAIVRLDGTATATGDILANQTVTVEHNGTNFHLMTIATLSSAAELNNNDGMTTGKTMSFGDYYFGTITESLAANAQTPYATPFVITHGLGTDDVDFGGSIGSSGVSGNDISNSALILAPGSMTVYVGRDSTLVTNTTDPSTGTLLAWMKNNGTLTRTITLKYWVRKRS